MFHNENVSLSVCSSNNVSDNHDYQSTAVGQLHKIRN